MHSTSAKNGLFVSLVAAVIAVSMWVLLAGSPPAAADDEAAARTKLETIIAGDHRTPGYIERDKYRHPLETLLFFGVREDMTVVEIWPGGGWYTEILAPYLNEKGKYYAAHRNRDTTDERILAGIKRYEEKLAGMPDKYSGVVITELSQKKGDIAPAGTADMVLTFRNIHNWMKFGFERHVFNAMFAALKPGGILGVVEHRADPNEFPDPQALSGYVQEEQVIQMAEAAGFKFVDKSEINANTKDTRDYPEGVWTLPPALRLKDKDRDRYLAIGESDRMTMKFIKPE